MPSLVTVLGNLFTDVSYLYLYLHLSQDLDLFSVPFPNMQYYAQTDKRIDADIRN